MSRIPVPWCMTVCPEFITETALITIRAWYREEAAQLRARETTRRVLRDEFAVDPLGDSLVIDAPSYISTQVLGGGELLQPEDDMPMFREPPLKTARDVYSLGLPPSYVDHPAMAPYIGMYRRLLNRFGQDRKVHLSSGIQGPVTTAVLLRGQSFFIDLIERPADAHFLLDFVTGADIRFMQELRELQGEPLYGGDVSISDDFAGLMSPDHFGEFVVPCYQRFFEVLNAGRRFLHSELLRSGHLGWLSEMHLNCLNLGENQYLKPSDVIKNTRVPFDWHVKTSTLAQGTPAMVREEYIAALEDGAVAMVAELAARRIPKENIQAFVEVARAFGPSVEPAGYYVASLRAQEMRQLTRHRPHS